MIAILLLFSLAEPIFSVYFSKIALKTTPQERSRLLSLTEDIKVGEWAQNVFKGRWKSTQAPKPQAKFIETTEGSESIMFQWNPELAINRIGAEMQILEGIYIEEKVITIYAEFNVTSKTQTSILAKNAIEVKLYDRLFQLNSSMKCNGIFEIGLRNQKGEELPISTEELANLSLNCKLQLDECQINFEVVNKIGGDKSGSAWIFMLIVGTSIIMGIYPMYKALRDNNVNSIAVLGDYTLLGNLVIDESLLTINMSFSLRIMVEYFEFFSLLTMLLMISVLFKMRFYLYLSDLRLTSRNLPEPQLRKWKLINLIFFIVFSVTILVASSWSIYYYKAFYFLYMYLIFQIYYNAFYVLKINCFKPSLHLQMFLPQIAYPLLLRCYPNNFFQLKTDYFFSVFLISLVCFFLFAMLAQRLFGPKFFVPKQCIPGYHDYYQKLDSSPLTENGTCPICFVELNENPVAETKDKPARFMQTPCGHKFHESCLQTWMEQSLVCPICRAALPPY